MGGPRWNLVFAASFALYFHIAGLPVEKPPDSNLLRFVLNVKPGIREPTPPSPPKPPMEKVQKGTSANSGNGGINAMSVGAVFGGQSKSGQSQSQQSGGQAFGQQQGGKAGNSAATGGSMASSRQSAASASQPADVGPAGRGPASPLPNGSGNGGAASATVMPSASAIPQPARSQPSRQPAATVAKPAAEDPYGLEIGPGVETSATTVVTVVTTRPQTTPTPTTTTASTTTSTAATTTTTKMPPCGPDVLFVLDSTGSVRLVYDDQRRYILEVAQQMDIGPNGQHVGLILYSSKIKQRIVVGLDQPLEKEKFLQTVRELPYHGGITATGTALGLTAKALANRRSGKRTLVVVLTDGYTYDEWESPSRALQALGPGVDVIVAGDVEHYLRPVLEKIVGDPAKVLLGEENKPKVLDYLRCR